MSSRTEGKTKHSLREGDAAAPPVTKRQKTTITPFSLLLEALDSQAEILRMVYSFLPLKDTLPLRKVHRKFNEAANDIFQYSFVMWWDALKNRRLDFDESLNYLVSQQRTLCNLVNNEYLCAVLRNETSSHVARRFIYELANFSKTDNGQTVSILLEDERCIVDVDQLELYLRKGFTAMAAVLQQDERVKKDIKMCRTCSNNIGCYKCINDEECAIAGEASRYCRECVLEDDRFCNGCKKYLCPSCFGVGAFHACEKCDGIVCNKCREFLLEECQHCDRVKCVFCVVEDGGERWRNGFGEAECPTCQGETSSSSEDE